MIIRKKLIQILCKAIRKEIIPQSVNNVSKLI